MTDFASGPFDREPLPAGFASFGVGAATTDASGVLLPSSHFGSGTIGLLTGAVPSTTLSALLRSALPPRLLPLGLESPPKAMAAEEVIGADMDKADFLSDATALRAIAADDFIAVDCASTDLASDLGLVLGADGAGAVS